MGQAFLGSEVKSATGRVLVAPRPPPVTRFEKLCSGFRISKSSALYELIFLCVNTDESQNIRKLQLLTFDPSFASI